ncbi:hypothetical protein [Paenibacillus azoreducens]|uniref:Uncharacterized protein n=1 Tax=Paenibacillus azoreducens TaxID=116718 RepID=A0A919YF57_9BACL|nr:hypothetical protein [Paenibacillus azoreducens]GIO48005.1 hypothetical protein J34TS1_27700 [Paenibacillus azoreducens]
MSDTWGKWSVYEYMRQMYMRAGTIPEWQELRSVFPEMRWAEIREGIEEFERFLGIGGGQRAQ